MVIVEKALGLLLGFSHLLTLVFPCSAAHGGDSLESAIEWTGCPEAGALLHTSVLLRTTRSAVDM